MIELMKIGSTYFAESGEVPYKMWNNLTERKWNNFKKSILKCNPQTEFKNLTGNPLFD